VNFHKWPQGLKALTLFQWQVVNVSFTLRWLNTGFHAQATWAPEQTNIETCHVLMAAWCSFWSVGNYAPQNMSIKTWTLKPITHRNMSSFSKQPNTHFNAQVARASKGDNTWEYSMVKHICWWECDHWSDSECNDIDWSCASYSSTRTQKSYPKFWNTWLSYQKYFKGYKCFSKESLNAKAKRTRGKKHENESQS